MRRTLIILAVFLWLAATALGSELVLPPELCLPGTPAEQRLLADLSDGRLDEQSILEAALIAASTPDAELAACVEKVNDRLARWCTRDDLQGTPRQRAAKLFELMHEELLTGGYCHDASNLAETLEHGRFNCVSATLLWQHLAAALEVPAIPRQLPGHMQSVLAFGDTRLVVETTCPRWFSLDDAEVRATLPAHPDGRELDDAALVACVYYNQGLALLAQHRYAAALAATYAAHRLDPASTAARANVLATLNNWALGLAEQGQTARALWMLQTGQSLAPEHESFRVNLGLLRTP
jgi:hypothetical protein